MTTPDTFMQAALELARLAGDVALAHFRAPVAIQTKSDGCPVTKAGVAAEAAALAWLGARWPKDGIVSEEAGLRQPESPRRWIIDPIDGTKTFLRGVPLWGTLVAVSEGTDLIAGAAYFPATGEWLAAAKECGCWFNGSRCAVSTVCQLKAATVLTTDATFAAHRDREAAWSSLSREVAMARTWGDCYGYMLVATGRAEAMVDDMVSPWDIAALRLAIEEAGGRYSDWRGERTMFGSDAIATNLALASIVRRRLGAVA